MKNMRRLMLFTCVFASSFTFTAITTQDTQKRSTNQQKEQQTPDFFFKPLEYSQTSISFFLKNIYNHHKYPQYFLALNFLHVGQGLSLAPQHEHPRRFVKKVLNLFDMKLQNIYVNPYAYADLLEQMVNHVARHCDIVQEKKEIINSLTGSIGSCIAHKFDDLKKNPESTLHTLAEEIYSIVAASDENDISIRELQHEIHYFLSRGLSILIWSPADQADSWMILRTIASSLEKAAEYFLIDSDMLDDLFWVVLQRYCLFIQMAAPQLQPVFFDTIRKSLTLYNDPLWTFPEREAYITTKRELIQTTLLQAETLVHLRLAGHVVPKFALT